MGKIKVSLITTVLNEESSIDQFLSSVFIQSLKPDELIIVDGGSQDKTVDKIIEFFKKHQSKSKIKAKVIIKEGANRSAGRNLAIQNSKNELIAITDAGCILDKNWLKNIHKPFVYRRIDVVAGYYAAQTKNVFEKCVVPFALVMPDRINRYNFLPSARSMAIRKSVWEKLGGFPEEFPDNEDFVFAKKLENNKAKILFCEEAKVYWQPRSNLKAFWIMIFRFARGDAMAGLRRFKVFTIFFRYILFVFLIIVSIIFYPLVKLTIFVCAGYLVWSIWKNYRYVKKLQALYILPVLQLTADLAVICGTIVGGLK